MDACVRGMCALRNVPPYPAVSGPCTDRAQCCAKHHLKRSGESECEVVVCKCEGRG